MSPAVRMSAVEIDGDDAAWLRGQLPPGAEIVERDEVDFWGRTYVEQPSGLLLPDSYDPVDRFVQRKIAEAERTKPRPIGVDLFCGAGGFSLGVHEAGFDVLAAAEWDAAAAATYLTNLGHPDCHVHMAGDGAEARWEKFWRAERKRGGKHGDPEPQRWGQHYLASRGEEDRGCRDFFFGDIAKLSGAAIIGAIGTDDVAVVFGGPPCQGLSSANSKACIEDPRNALLWEFLRIVLEIRPQTFIIENVPQLLSVAKGALFNALCARANEGGYDVVAQKINAVWYGVPQHRVRALVVGTREGAPEFQFPMPNHWALGRRADGQRWQIGSDYEDEGEGEAVATFDEQGRTWSAPAAVAKADDQVSLFGGEDR